MAEESDEQSKIKVIVFILAIALISGLIIWFVGGMLSQPMEPPKKTVQEIKVIRPPPPPPEVEEEPPPEPEVEEEILEPESEPEPLPDLPDIPDIPDSPDLGDGVDGPPSDFGTNSGRTIGGGGKKGDPSLWYAGKIVQGEILDLLNSIEGLTDKSYRVNLNIWINKVTGELTDFKLLNSTGDITMDEKIKHALQQFGRFSRPPLPNLKQPIRLAIESG